MTKHRRRNQRVRIMRIELVPLELDAGGRVRTDLMCIACGRFATHFAVPGRDDEVHAGIHYGCYRALRVAAADARRSKRTARKGRQEDTHGQNEKG